MYKLVLLLSGLLLFLGCRNKPEIKPFDRADNVIKYLKEVQGLDITKKRTILFIITGACGSCTQHTIRFVKELDQDPDYADWQKILVTGGLNAVNLLSQFSVIKFIKKTDKDFALERYGLMYFDDMIIEYADNGTSVYFEHLSSSKINAVTARYYR